MRDNTSSMKKSSDNIQNSQSQIPAQNVQQRQLPVLSERQDPRYFAMHAQAKSEKKAKRKALVLGIIAAVLALAICALIVYIVKPFGLFQETIDVDAPSQFQVQEAFESSDIPYPSVSNFKYVNTSNLKMASIGNYTSSEVEVTQAKSGARASSEGRAVAHYRNGYIDVDQQLALRMEYDTNECKWTPGSAIEESITATPSDIADVTEIQNDLPNILKSYDAAIAAMYEGAQTEVVADLTLEGGTIDFTLTRIQEDGSSSTCTVKTDVSWSQGSGWNVDIVSTEGDLPEKEPEATTPQNEQPSPSQPETVEPQTPVPTENSSQQTNPDSSSTPDPYDGATLSLVCYSGDLIEVTGTIQFDTSGRVLLKTDKRIAVILDGRTYVVDYFEVTGLSFTNGAHGSIIGYVSASGKTSTAPLLINTDI